MKYFILIFMISIQIGLMLGDRNFKSIGVNNQNDIENEISSLIVKQRDLSQCPCEDPSLCNIITKPPGKELMGFAIFSNYTYLANYLNWTRITSLSITLDNDTDPRIICLAHQHGVRIIHRSIFPQDGWNYPTQNQWLIDNLGLLNRYFVDGITLDFEMPVSNQTMSNELSQFVIKISESLDYISPYLQLSYCVDVGQDNIDFTVLNKVIDFYLVMAYDLSWNSNPLGSNSPYPKVTSGIEDFIKQVDISPDQLVLGLPWYGYYGQCLNMSGLLNSTCHTQVYSSPLSLSYASIYHILNTYPNSGELWDQSTLTPYLNYEINQEIYQVQYDNPISIYYKVQYAKTMDLRGVGVWAVDFLNSLPVQGAAEAAMWDSLNSFFE